MKFGDNSSVPMKVLAWNVLSNAIETVSITQTGIVQRCRKATEVGSAWWRNCGYISLSCKSLCEVGSTTDCDRGFSKGKDLFSKGNDLRTFLWEGKEIRAS